ncbi:MAG: L-rhamnose/proton symporter RhaT [Ferruginibacter sp.]
MGIILGVLFHFAGGFASGSFYTPYKKVKGWSWETFWIVGGIFSWVIAPLVAAYLTIPNFKEIISSTDGSVLKWTYIMGVLWGIGGFTYGLGVRYLGVALGSSIILGLCSVFGAIIPSIYYHYYPQTGKDSIVHMLSNSWGQFVLIGLAVCVLGIIICGKAGSMKEKELGGQELNKQDFHLGKGLVVAIISGVLSACFNFGLEAGSSMAAIANEQWVAQHPGQGEFLYRNNVVYVVLLWGGLTTNLIGCMVMNARNKSFGEYTNGKTPLLRNYFFCAIAGILWFLQFFFYGMGESKMGNGASSWILHMAFIILIANLWGIALKEWKGVSKKTAYTIAAGIAVILLAVLIVGYGNSLK